MMSINNDNQNIGLWCLTPLSIIFSYIVAASFIGGGNWRIQRPVASH